MSGGPNNTERDMKKRTDREDLRRKEADERNAQWRALTPEQQLKELDKRGVKASKQRMKIERLIATR